MLIFIFMVKFNLEVQISWMSDLSISETESLMPGLELT